MDKKFIDVNSHEFTLQALSDLWSCQEKLRKMTMTVNRLSRTRFLLACVVGYCLYDNLNQKIKKNDRIRIDH